MKKPFSLLILSCLCSITSCDDSTGVDKNSTEYQLTGRWEIGNNFADTLMPVRSLTIDSRTPNRIIMSGDIYEYGVKTKTWRDTLPYVFYDGEYATCTRRITQGDNVLEREDRIRVLAGTSFSCSISINRVSGSFFVPSGGVYYADKR